MEVISINANKRADVGKKSTKAARKEGLVPGVIYGGKEVVHFTAKPFDFRDLVYTADFKLAEINVEGTPVKCILKDIQFHPVTEDIVHMDFVELVDGQNVIVEIPVRFKGVAPGVKVGGKLIQLVRRVKVKTTPDKLVNALYADISTLELGQSARVRDIEAGEDLEIMNNGSIPVCAIEIPRALRSATAAAAAKDGEEA